MTEVELIHPTIDTDLVNMIGEIARVSSSGPPVRSNEDLLRYMIRNGHWSPFEMANICLKITTTRDITRQILRHRSFSFQEFSQRYSKAKHFVKDRECRLQDHKNRQSSLPCDNEFTKLSWERAQEYVLEIALEEYAWAIKNGVAKEVARALLPEGLTTSTLYMNGSVRSWIHYISVRTDPSTQEEHREVADLCSVVIQQIFPMIEEFNNGNS